MSTITTERLTKILSETQAVISECNSRGVHGSVEVNARLFENVLMELLRHRAAMLRGAQNVESRCTIQPATALDSLPKNYESRCSISPVIPEGWGLVPFEPTLEMVKAGADAASVGMLIPGMYRAMLAAAPRQEVKPCT